MPRRQVGRKSNRSTDTEAQQNFKGRSDVAFLEGKGNGEGSRARLTPCNRLRAGAVPGNRLALLELTFY